ncbi:MAG: hypothetical protein ACK4PN_10635 [Allorhizobium sp.]
MSMIVIEASLLRVEDVDLLPSLLKIEKPQGSDFATIGLACCRMTTGGMAALAS